MLEHLRISLIELQKISCEAQPIIILKYIDLKKLRQIQIKLVLKVDFKYKNNFQSQKMVKIQHVLYFLDFPN